VHTRYIHGWTSFNRIKLCQTVCYLTFFLYSQTFSGLVKRLAGSLKKGSDPNLYANKVLLQVAHAFLYTWMDFFHRCKLCPSRCYLPLFHIERSIALVKRWDKGLKLIQTCTLTKCYSRWHAFHTLMVLSINRLLLTITPHKFSQNEYGPTGGSAGTITGR
jgi:hypothetical protein